MKVLLLPLLLTLAAAQTVLNALGATGPLVHLPVPSGLTDFKVDQFSLLGLHRSLVEISSVTETETNTALFLRSYLMAAGFTVELQPVGPSADGSTRYNVYAYFGSVRNTTVLVTSHIDTVPPFFPYRVDGQRIYGRGAADAKASVAAQVLAVLSLAADGRVGAGDVALLFVVGEETDGLGMLAVLASLGASWRAAIFGEPTENKLGVGHKGVYAVEISANGKAAHSGYPQLGVSASELLVPVLANLLQLEFPSDKLLGNTTLNIGQVDIGVANNVIPAHGSAHVFARVACCIEEVDRRVRAVVDAAGPRVVGNYSMARNPTYLDYDVPGFDSVVLAYSTDVPNLLVDVAARFLYGPGSILVAHGADEYVENDSLLEAVKGYKKLVEYSLKKYKK